MKEYEILKDLIKFNTIKDKENKEILDYIEGYLKSIGFKTDYKDKNLIMSIGKNPKNRIFRTYRYCRVYRRLEY